MRKNSVYLGIIMLMLSIIVISGCVTVEKTAVTTSSDQMIELGDLPEMALISRNYMSVPNGSEFNISAYQLGNINITKYQEANSTPNDTRNVGENLLWKNETGKRIQIGYIKYDTDEGFKDFFGKQQRACFNKLNNTSRVAANFERGCGQAGIGEYDIYITQASKDNPDIKRTTMQFARSNYFIVITVDDRNDKSVNETLRIASLIEGRLPKNNFLKINI